MRFNSIHTNNELLQRIAEGDEKAFAELFDQNWDNLYGVVFSFTKSAVIAEEIVQDIFLKIWLKRELLASVENPDSYLFTLARNHILNVLRKKVKEESFTKQLSAYFLKNEYSPEARLLAKESEQVINEAIAQLPKQQKLIYQLSRQQGLSQEDIARQLNISKHTVKSHMNKALHAIRAYIRPYVGEIILLILFLSH